MIRRFYATFSKTGRIDMNVELAKNVGISAPLLPAPCPGAGDGRLYS
ncbi:MAG: hypothetical protein R3D66_05180 [Alphaproteobacteria bacterium]